MRTAGTRLTTEQRHARDLAADRAHAWRTFLHRYDGLLRATIVATAADRGYYLQEADREEIRARFLAELWAHRDAKLVAFDPALGSSFASWLRLLAQRTTIDHLRALPRERPVPRAPDRPAFDDTPEERLAEKEAADLVRAAARALKPRDRALFELHVARDLDPVEIAHLERVPVKAIYSRRDRMIERLRVALRRRLRAERLPPAGRAFPLPLVA